MNSVLYEKKNKWNKILYFQLYTLEQLKNIHLYAIKDVNSVYNA